MSPFHLIKIVSTLWAARKTVWGSPLVEPRLLCEHSRIERGADKEIRQAPEKERNRDWAETTKSIRILCNGVPSRTKLIKPPPLGVVIWLWTKLYQKNVAYKNSINFIEYSGGYAIWKVGVVTRYERRCIPLACVNSFRTCNSFAANQYLMLERKIVC